MLLATDLDGTFLAGSADNRLRLYQLINSHPDIRLPYVTGRGLESVLPLLSDPTLPVPDYVVCDVGATVVDGVTQQPLQPLQSQIAARWPGDQIVVAALEHIEGIERQDVPQERRCSYFCASNAVTEDLRRVVEDVAQQGEQDERHDDEQGDRAVVAAQLREHAARGGG
ncbi:MAG: HAD family hydrolase, partial [Gammaproteobacteria bacterium]